MSDARRMCAGLLVIAALGAPARADDAAIIAARNAELQKHVDSYREVPLATRREDMKFQPVTLNTLSLEYRGAHYDGVRFHTGSATGTFYWAFTCSPRIDHWYIVPATGTMEQAFTRWDTGVLTEDLGGQARAGAKVYFQTLPAGLLKRDTTYVIWLSFRDAAPCELGVTAAILGGPAIPSRQRYPMRKPETGELEEMENDFVDAFPASVVQRPRFASGLKESVDPQLFAALQKQTAAKGFSSTVDSGIRPEIPPAGALLVGFKFGRGWFAGNTIIKTIQPLFLTVEGLTPGRVYGQGNLDEVVAAPPGYAVGAMRIRTGDRLDGMSLRFMRIVPGQIALDPNQAVQSVWCGGDGGSIRQIGGTGKPVIGVAIKSGADVDNLGLALLL